MTSRQKTLGDGDHICDSEGERERERKMKTHKNKFCCNTTNQPYTISFIVIIIIIIIIIISLLLVCTVICTYLDDGLAGVGKLGQYHQVKDDGGLDLYWTQTLLQLSSTH